MKQFENNLKRIKGVMKRWAKNLSTKSQKELKKVEEGIIALFENNNAGIFSEDEAQTLKDSKC